MAEMCERREERTAVDWIAVARFPDGTEIPCTVKDVSVSGMKIALPASQTVSESFMVRIVGRNLAFRVKRAWRREHQVGVTIEKIVKLVPKPEPAAKPPEPTTADDETQHTRIGFRSRYRADP